MRIRLTTAELETLSHLVGASGSVLALDDPTADSVRDDGWRSLIARSLLWHDDEGVPVADAALLAAVDAVLSSPTAVQVLTTTPDEGAEVGFVFQSPTGFVSVAQVVEGVVQLIEGEIPMLAASVLVNAEQGRSVEFKTIGPTGEEVQPAVTISPDGSVQGWSIQKLDVVEDVEQMLVQLLATSAA